MWLPRKLVQFEWRAFVRSASFQLNLALKIVIGVAAAFYSVLILFLGVAAYYGLEENGLAPFATINRALIYWWAFDLITRYFLQKSPVAGIRPMLVLPVKKKHIVRYLLGKSALSFFNIYPAFFFLPFSIVLLKEGFSPAGVLSWHLAAISLTFGNNYLNLLLRNKTKWFIFFSVIMVTVAGLAYFSIWDISIYSAPIFQSFFKYPLLGWIMLGLPLLLYRINYRYYMQALKLDHGLFPKTRPTSARRYSWLERFGRQGAFLKNDLKLIVRNKRSRNMVLTCLVVLLYGFLMTSSTDSDQKGVFLMFVGVFISGGFLFTFGSYVPSWDSAYYPLMMSQNIQYKDYVSSKWWLIIAVTILTVVLATCYLFWNARLYRYIVVGGIYNIGINTYIVLLSGAFMKTPIELTTGKKIFGETKGFSLKLFLISIPKLVLPLLLFFIFNKIWNETAALIGITLLSLMGLVFRNYAFRLIEKIYKKEKYATLAAYKTSN